MSCRHQQQKKQEQTAACCEVAALIVNALPPAQDHRRRWHVRGKVRVAINLKLWDRGVRPLTNACCLGLVTHLDDGHHRPRSLQRRRRHITH